MQTGSRKTGKRNGVRHKLLGMPRTAYFCVHFKYLIFLTHTWDRQNTYSPIKCKELHVRLVHLTTLVGLAAVLQGFLYWQHTTTAALPLCYPTCQAQLGCLTQDPFTSCTGYREPGSPAALCSSWGICIFCMPLHLTEQGWEAHFQVHPSSAQYPRMPLASKLIHPCPFWVTQQVNSHVL